MASSEAILYYAEQPAEEFVMEEGAVLCQRDQDFQKMMKAKKKIIIMWVFLTCTRHVFKLYPIIILSVIQLISIVDQ